MTAFENKNYDEIY